MLHSFLQIVRERKKTKCQRKYQRVKEGEICEHSRTFTVDWKRFRFETVTDLLWGEYYEIKQHLSKRLKKTSKVSVCNNHFSTSWWKLLYVFPIDVTRNEHLKQETRKKMSTSEGTKNWGYTHQNIQYPGLKIGGRKLLYVFPIDVTRNEHLKQETRKKCQPRKERKIGGILTRIFIILI